MVHRVVPAVGGFTAILALAGCGGGPTAVQAESAPSTAAPTSASEPAARPDKLTGPASTDREVTELTGFVSPTGNVACLLDADWARCDIIDRDWAAPARPADCEFDCGQGSHSVQASRLNSCAPATPPSARMRYCPMPIQSRPEFSAARAPTRASRAAISGPATASRFHQRCIACSDLNRKPGGPDLCGYA